MPKVLTTQQIEHLREAGFSSPFYVMSKHQATQNLDRLESAEQTHPAELNAENRNKPHLAFTLLDELAHQPVVVHAVEDSLGPNLPLWSSVLFIKEPQSKGFVSWHQDATCIGIELHEYITPWLASTPGTPENGCVSMLTGSRNSPVRKHDDSFRENGAKFLYHGASQMRAH